MLITSIEVHADNRSTFLPQIIWFLKEFYSVGDRKLFLNSRSASSERCIQ